MIADHEATLAGASPWSPNLKQLSPPLFRLRLTEIKDGLCEMRPTCAETCSKQPVHCKYTFPSPFPHFAEDRQAKPPQRTRKRAPASARRCSVAAATMQRRQRCSVGNDAALQRRHARFPILASLAAPIHPPSLLFTSLY